MHEFALTEQLLAAALGAVADRTRAADSADKPRMRIAEIHLRVGSLTGIVPDGMRFCFAPLALGTPAAGACLVIADDPAMVACTACGAVAQAALPLAPVCAQCGGRVEVSGGDSLVLEQIVLEECVTPADAVLEADAGAALEEAVWP